MDSNPEHIEIFVGSGNVFADLGLPNAEELQFKSSLRIEIRQAIAEKKLSRAQPERQIGLSKEDLARLLKGPSADFTFDQLFQVLNRLGRRVEVRISPPQTDPADARPLLVAA